MKVYCQRIDSLGNAYAVLMSPDYFQADWYGVAMEWQDADFMVDASWNELSGCEFWTDSFLSKS